MRASVLILSVLFISCASKITVVHDYVGVYDLEGMPFKYEMQYEIHSSSVKNIEHNDQIRNEVSRLIQRTLSRYRFDEIAFSKRDSIENLTNNAILNNISSESIKISNIKALNLWCGGRLYNAYVSMYGQLDRIKKL